MREADRAAAVERDTGLFVALSELRVEPAAAGALIRGFRDRLGLVDAWPGFHGLEVWQDQRDSGRFAMVSWWSSREAFAGYMRSEDHDLSHARIPTGAARPRPLGLSRFELVAR